MMIRKDRFGRQFGNCMLHTSGFTEWQTLRFYHKAVLKQRCSIMSGVPVRFTSLQQAVQSLIRPAYLSSLLLLTSCIEGLLACWKGPAQDVREGFAISHALPVHLVLGLNSTDIC